MDKKIILQNQTRNTISEKDQRTTEERSFHLPLDMNPNYCIIDI